VAVIVWKLVVHPPISTVHIIMEWKFKQWWSTIPPI